MSFLPTPGATDEIFTAPMAEEGDADAEDGVDLAQIRDMLRRTPEQRLEALRGFTAGLIEMMDAAQRA